MTPSQFQSIRERSGLTRSQLAKAIGVEARSIYRYEHGERRISGTVENLMLLIDRGVKISVDT